ncbi:FecR family protein [Pseudoflavitalea rhizosphaerae]|uniref:FecR family protein n=1 Tax=Pseudoflavitalea rhizosphaerae TaxID=1884793 RepID=UPI0013DEF4C8|nr:FecR family protein [Pseudoflavitalea rhizosphaerae]
MNPVDFKKIINAWLDGGLDKEGRKQLAELLMLPEYQEQLDAIMQEQQEQGYTMQAAFEESYVNMRRSLQTRIQPKYVRMYRIWWAAAAAVVVFIAGIWFFGNDQKTNQTAAEQPKPAIEIPAGQEGAVLTLADGSKMILDSMGNGMLSHQNGSDLLLSNGQLEYKKAGEVAGEETYNTLSTPKGRQFRLMLPDGSVAWLNAASSIRYPTRFTKDVRRVEVTGEVYFEAATVMQKGKKVPLVVNADNRFEVEVLGTHFNVNAYADEPALNTTLLEGKVSVTSTRSGEKVVLQPGEQASLQTQAGAMRELVVRKADAGKVMAWKNGVFDFEDARIDEVMRQLKRWYDIDVKYESGVPDIEFVGKMTRDIPLNGLLIALKKSNVHFRLEGRTLIVTP